MTVPTSISNTPMSPLAGLQMPPGSPDELVAIRTSYSRMSSTMREVSGESTKAVSGVVGTAWLGPNATRTDKAVRSYSGAAGALAAMGDQAGSILLACETEWREALDLWHRGQSLADSVIADEQAHQQTGAAQCTSMGLHGQAADPAGFALAAAAANGRDAYTSPDRATATSLGQTAVQRATDAIHTAASRLSALAATAPGTDPPKPLFGPSGLPDPNKDMDQGTPGDCYFMAALAAVAQRDPEFIKKNIKQNSDGTYTVTLYKNGKPVQVTVSGDIPGDGNGQGAAYTDSNTWVAIYEKAYAKLDGGYKKIGKGGDTEDPLETITGRDAHSTNWNNSLDDILNVVSLGNAGGPPSLGDVQKSLDNGEAMVACTPTYGKKINGEDATTVEGQTVVGDHCYRVDRVYTDTKTGKQMVEIVNPWGQEGQQQGFPEYIQLTQADFQKYFNEVASVPGRS